MPPSNKRKIISEMKAPSIQHGIDEGAKSQEDRIHERIRKLKNNNLSSVYNTSDGRMTSTKKLVEM
jgi:hypothetical protein